MIMTFSRWIPRRPKRVLTAALLLLIPSILCFIATKVNYDVLSYLPQDVASVQGEQLLEEPFHAAATSMVIVEGMPPKYTDDLLSDIKKVPHVSNALWLSGSLGIQVPTEFFPTELRDSFYSDDNTMMIVQYDRPLSSEETMEAVVSIRRLMNERCYIAGMSAMVEDIKELVLSEIPVYTVIAVLLTLLVLLLAFESPVMPFLFLSCIGFAVVYNMGTNILLGQISSITQAIAAILQLAVTMDYSIFLYRRYEEEKRVTDDLPEAMARAMTAAFAALSGSSLTTIAGFLSLCAMRFGLGPDMGVVMAKGVVIGILCVVLVLPCMILLCDRWIGKWQHRSLIPDFTGFNRWILKHRRIWIAVFLLLLVPAFYSSKRVDIYYQISRSLPKSLPSLQSNEKMKEAFGIATEHVIILDRSVDNASLEEMEDRLKEVPGIDKVLSMNSLLGKGIPDFFVPDRLRDVFQSEDYQLVMLTSTENPATDRMAEQLSSITEIVKAYDPSALITGESAMTEDLREVFDKDYVVTSYLSVAAIFLIVMLVFRSLSVPAALILAIELAINVNLGLCWFRYKSISFIAPTLISAIQLGATVDYAILITSRFQEEIRNGKDRMEAAVLAGSHSAPSVITSALVMFSANIGVTLVSRLYLIQEVCTLLARGAMISAFVTAFMVPCILYEMEPVFRRTSMNWDGSGKKGEEVIQKE